MTLLKNPPASDPTGDFSSDTLESAREQTGYVRPTAGVGAAPPQGLTDRWYPLRPHPEHHRLWTSQARFRVIPAGRRSGKTEIAKRFTVREALKPKPWSDPWYVLSAPTLQQARRIYWRDLKLMVPPELRDGRPRESELTLRLVTGAEITVLGMDAPERVEGRSLDGIVMDEYGNMKEKVWPENVRPALSDRLGWGWLIGVPEGRNHYYKMWQRALKDDTGEWDGFHWFSADILPAAEIASAKRELDPLTFRQEYEGSFINFEGRAYYQYDPEVHAVERTHYNPDLSLVFCFDFNVSPGICVVLQEQEYKGTNPDVQRDRLITHVIGEVWIPQNSNTELVCRRLLKDWGHHEGDIFLYGDATGGAKGSAKVRGSDWALVSMTLGATFYGRMRDRVPKKNPKERERINAVNSRLKSTDGVISCILDAYNTPHLQTDLEGVTLVEGGSGEIDKHASDELTHISDGFGYYIERRFPVAGKHKTVIEEY